MNARELAPQKLEQHEGESDRRGGHDGAEMGGPVRIQFSVQAAQNPTNALLSERTIESVEQSTVEQQF